MKKFLALMGLVSLLAVPSVTFADDIMDITREYQFEVSETYHPKSSIVIDADSGDVLFEENPDLGHDPASISKLMTTYLVLEAIKNKKLSMDSTITATPRHQAIVGNSLLSNNKIVAGVTYKLSDLFPMTLVASSNVTTLMMSEMITDDPDEFIDMMNKRAQELGMKNTHWYNASGAEAASFAGQYNPTRYDNYAFNETTARDLAILAYHLVNEYPEVLEYTKNHVVTVMEGTPYQETLTGYNHALPGARYGLEGVDGLKTGSSPHADYNVVATMKKDGHRLIEVLMGVSNWDDDDGEYLRHPIGNALFLKYFDTYEYKKVLSKGLQTVDGKQVQLDKDFYATVKKGEKVKLKLDGNMLTVDNGLETVSPLISNGIQVKEQEKSLVEKATSNAGAVLTGKFWKSLLFDYKLIFLFPVLLLVLILVYEKKRRQKHHRISASHQEPLAVNLESVEVEGDGEQVYFDESFDPEVAETEEQAYFDESFNSELQETEEYHQDFTEEAEPFVSEEVSADEMDPSIEKSASEDSWSDQSFHVEVSTSHEDSGEVLTDIHEKVSDDHFEDTVVDHVSEEFHTEKPHTRLDQEERSSILKELEALKPKEELKKEIDPSEFE